MPRHHTRKSQARPTLLLILLLGLIGVGLLGAALWDRHERQLESARYEGESLYSPERFSVTLNGRSYQLRDGLECFLLMGLDSFSTEKTEPDAIRNDQQADFLFLLVVDHSTQSCCALHINRDTMAEIDRYGLAGRRLKGFTGQLALSHTYGSGKNDSCRYTCDAVSRLLLGLPIRHYLSLTMDAIPVLNDLVGGVKVTIEDDFSNSDPTLIQGQTQTLHGKQALTFVRARGHMNDSSNLNRMKRQRVYMQALYETLTGKLRADEDLGLRLARELSDYMVSDLSVEELSALAEKLKDYRYDGVLTIEGEAKRGEKYMEFYVDTDALQTLLTGLVLEEY